LAAHSILGGFNMTIRFLAALSGAALACACSGSNPKMLPSSTVQVAALFTTPGGVICIKLVASNAMRSTSKTFSVTPGQSTVSLTMTGIPTGNVMFSGQAFNIACGFIDSSVVPTWVADDVTATVNANTAASVQLKFRGNGTANVGGNFVGDNYTVTTIAGAGTQGSAAAPARSALFEGPNGLALSADGTTLFVDDRNFDPVTFATVGMTIRSVDTTTGQVTTLAGSATQSGTADGPGANARFSRLFAVALSGTNLLIADRCAIRSMSTSAPYTVTTLVGIRSTTNPNLWDCRPAVSVLSGSDLDIAVRGSNVYAADNGHSVVQKISLTSSPPTFTLVAGIPDVPGSDDGTIATAHFQGPTGLVFPFVGDDPFYLIDTTFTGFIYGLVRRISPLEDSVLTVAGAPQTTFVSTDGLGTHALFAQPRRAVSDGSNLYIGDAFSVRRLDVATTAVVTIAGDMTSSGFADGVGGAARFNAAFGIARDSRNGVIYIADQGNFAIRKLTPP
jgi:hypothetical protein